MDSHIMLQETFAKLCHAYWPVVLTAFRHQDSQNVNKWVFCSQRGFIYYTGNRVNPLWATAKVERVTTLSPMPFTLWAHMLWPSLYSCHLGCLSLDCGMNELLMWHSLSSALRFLSKNGDGQAGLLAGAAYGIGLDWLPYWIIQD